MSQRNLLRVHFDTKHPNQNKSEECAINDRVYFSHIYEEPSTHDMWRRNGKNRGNVMIWTPFIRQMLTNSIHSNFLKVPGVCIAIENGAVVSKWRGSPIYPSHLVFYTTASQEEDSRYLDRERESGVLVVWTRTLIFSVIHHRVKWRLSVLIITILSLGRGRTNRKCNSNYTQYR